MTLTLPVSGRPVRSEGRRGVCACQGHPPPGTGTNGASTQRGARPAMRPLLGAVRGGPERGTREEAGDEVSCRSGVLLRAPDAQRRERPEVARPQLGNEGHARRPEPRQSGGRPRQPHLQGRRACTKTHVSEAAAAPEGTRSAALGLSPALQLRQGGRGGLREPPRK